MPKPLWPNGGSSPARRISPNGTATEQKPPSTTLHQPLPWAVLPGLWIRKRNCVSVCCHPPALLRLFRIPHREIRPTPPVSNAHILDTTRRVRCLFETSH